jgi:hypothetical protein
MRSEDESLSLAVEVLAEPFVDEVVNLVGEA